MPLSVRPSPRPAGPAVMRQNWRRLLFLHWSEAAGKVQATLPAGLTVDPWEGRAWLGIVPFRMEAVRPRFCPAAPGISNFPELNVRTYVRDAQGRTGVWFYSLDCAQPLAVWAARAFFGLPYFPARMRERVCPSGEVSYECRRQGSAQTARFAYRGVDGATIAGEGTIEQFLIERYRLFAVRRGRLFTGEVWHEPYPLQRAEVFGWDGEPLRQAGFAVGAQPFAHAIFSPGVDVRVFPVAPV